MASDIQKLYDLPDISFIDDLTMDDLKNEMYSDFNSIREDQTGETYELNEMSKYGFLINATALKLYQAMQYIDRAGKMNLLKYSTGDFLKNLGATRSVEYSEPVKAISVERFSITETRTEAISIPSGTRVSDGTDLYFETIEDVVISAGILYVDVGITCMEYGTIGNGKEIGTIVTLVDPYPFADTVSNITESAGGIDEESDEDYREKVYLSTSGYATTGTEDSYLYWCKQYDSELTSNNVKILNPQELDISIIVVKDDGEIPNNDYLTGLEQYIKNQKKNPMGDRITAVAASVVSYDIELTYYINKSDLSNIDDIQANVSSAVEIYKKWQQAKIGRDVNSDYLRSLLVQAGIKRVSITSQDFIVVDDLSIAKNNATTISYGGVEDD
ncbi:MAG: baseplate J/gp47 family protein [Velocimicrobium sp.]